MVYSVTVNTTLTFDDLEPARLAAQAVEVLSATAREVGGGVRITELPTFRDVSVHAPVVDRSRHVVGFQAAEEQVRKITVEVDKMADLATPDPAFWVDLFATARNTGQVDFVSVTSLTMQRLGLSEETVRKILGEVIAGIAAAAAQRAYKDAVTPAKVRK